MKTHANFIWFCNTYLSGCYGPYWKFGCVKKRCENAQKRCEIVNIEEFPYENPANLIYSCSS